MCFFLFPIQGIKLKEKSRSLPASSVQPKKDSPTVYFVLHVTGLPKQTVTPTHLLDHFENNQHGGPVKSITITTGNAAAVVTFVNETGKLLMDFLLR